jgi:tripeptide aminopeptidase
MLPASFEHDVLTRFLRFVKINTQSDPFSTFFPSTTGQYDLSRLLVEELLELGLSDAHLDEFDYVYATLPSNIDKIVSVICFCAHVDTSSDAPGDNVVPIIHANYNGNNLIFPDNPSLYISPENEPDLSDQMGNVIITASGLTLLGADNKAGVAAIMNAINLLVSNPSIPHGTIKVLFTPDEEIGQGVNVVNLEKLGADFAITIDGERKGTIEDETFSADNVVLESFPDSSAVIRITEQYRNMKEVLKNYPFITDYAI